MVGWMGGCCCGPSEPPSGVCANGLLEQFTDDFSPDFDPAWGVSGLVTDAGICRATGQQLPWYSGYTQGVATTRYQKFTLAGKNEVTVKLVDWQDTPLLPGHSSQTGIILNGAGILPFGVGPFVPLFRAGVFAYRTSTINQYVYNSPFAAINYTGVVPQDGDVFGLRLSNHVVNNALDFEVLAQKVEVLVNGVAVWSQTGSGVVAYLKCDFTWNIMIWQQAFSFGFPVPGRTILKLDDFAVVNE